MHHVPKNNRLIDYESDHRLFAKKILIMGTVNSREKSRITPKPTYPKKAIFLVSSSFNEPEDLVLLQDIILNNITVIVGSLFLLRKSLKNVHFGGIVFIYTPSIYTNY